MKCEVCATDGYGAVTCVTYAGRLTANLCTTCRRRYEDQVEELVTKVVDNMKEDIMTETQRVTEEAKNGKRPR